jgi:hypothetical protein
MLAVPASSPDYTVFITFFVVIIIIIIIIIITHNDLNLRIGNHYFSPDLKPDIICEYFSHLEKKLDTTNYRVILLGDLNVPGFDWESGLPSENCQFYSKLRGDAI